MTRPPDLVEAVCARCGTVYTTYFRPTVNRELEPWSDEGGSVTPAACPECGAALGHDDALEPHVIGPHPSRGSV
jgi:hypothetical protein